MQIQHNQCDNRLCGCASLFEFVIVIMLTLIGVILHLTICIFIFIKCFIFVSFTMYNSKFAIFESTLQNGRMGDFLLTSSVRILIFRMIFVLLFRICPYLTFKRRHYHGDETASYLTTSKYFKRWRCVIRIYFLGNVCICLYILLSFYVNCYHMHFTISHCHLCLYLHNPIFFVLV